MESLAAATAQQRSRPDRGQTRGAECDEHRESRGHAHAANPGQELQQVEWREGEASQERRGRTKREQEPGDHRAAGRDRSAGGRPERNRFGAGLAGPQRGDEGQCRRVGHTRGDATEDTAKNEHLDRTRVRGDQAGRYREPNPEQEHHLAAVTVAQRSQPEHRARQSERVRHRHQVELRLGRVERLADLASANNAELMSHVRPLGRLPE